MSIMHICGDFCNFYADLFGHEIVAGINLRCFYYTTRYKTMSKFNYAYLDSYNSDIKYLRTPLFFKKRINYVTKEFLKKYEVNQYNIIHAHMLYTDGYIAYRAHDMLHIPYIVAVRNSDLNSLFFNYMPWMQKLCVKILSNASKIIFLSPSYAKRMYSKLSAKYHDNFNIKSKSIVIPNGINDYWQLNKLVSTRKVPKDAIHLLTVGDINFNKNQINVMRAVKLLKNEGYNIYYTVVGNIKNTLLASILRINNVEVLPFCDVVELRQLYLHSDIYVMPSIHETFGRVYVEAMSQGLPVIYTRGEGFDEQLPNGYVGFAVNPKSPEEIASSIKNVLVNYVELSQHAVESAARFSWHKIAMEYIDIYNSVI